MRPTVECLKFDKLFLLFFMMSEARWTVENVVSINKGNVVIKLPVKG